MVFILPHAVFRSNDHREYAPHFNTQIGTQTENLFRVFLIELAYFIFFSVDAILKQKFNSYAVF